MRLVLKEVIMTDRHMSDGQLYLFLQIFSTLKKSAYIEDSITPSQITCCLYSI